MKVPKAKRIDRKCPYCGKICSPDDEWTYTKRGVLIYFHMKCLLDNSRHKDYNSKQL